MVGACNFAWPGMLDCVLTHAPDDAVRQRQHTCILYASETRGQRQQSLHVCAMQADAEPSKASHLLITIHRCEGLQQQQQQQLAAPDQQPQQQSIPARRPYCHYTPPGRSVPHDTALGDGPHPSFDDAASWGLVKGTELMAALQIHTLQVGGSQGGIFGNRVAQPACIILMSQCMQGASQFSAGVAANDYQLREPG